MVSKKNWLGILVLVFEMALALGMAVSCDGGGDGGSGGKINTPSTTTSTYTYSTGDGYEMVITKKNPAKNILPMKSIYPSSSYENGGSARAILSNGETATYVLKYNGVVKSTGQVLMGPTTATFTPGSGKPPFTGTLLETALTISGDVTFDDNTRKQLSAMKNISSQVAAFAEYFGTWRATISGHPVTLEVGNAVWELRIDGSFNSSGVYVQTSASTADIWRLLPRDEPTVCVGIVTTTANKGMRLDLNDNGAFPGIYELTR